MIVMKAHIVSRPSTFDRVDRVKQAVGQPVLPGDDGLWILGGPLVVDIDGATFTAPRGFTTDGASIPTFAQAVTGWKRWDPPQRWGGIVHDWLYTQRGVAKAFADRAFLAVLADEGTPVWERDVMYAAVVLFGGRAYETDQARGPRIYDEGSAA